MHVDRKELLIRPLAGKTEKLTFLPRGIQGWARKVKSIYRTLRLHLVVRKIEFYQSLDQKRFQSISNSHLRGLCSVTCDLGLVRFILETGLP